VPRHNPLLQKSKYQSTLPQYENSPQVNYKPVETPNDTPYFHILMPNWWGDVLKEGYSTSLWANAVDLTAKTAVEDASVKNWGSRANNVAQTIDKYTPDFLRKANVSDDYSEYSEDILFDIGATIVSIGVDFLPIAAASTVSGGTIGAAGAGAKAFRLGKISDKIVKSLPKSIKAIKEGFKKKGVGDGVTNKVTKSLYETFSNPKNLIHSGNTLGIYGGAHDIVNQKLYHEDGASWMNKIDYAQTVDSSLAMWKSGVAFPIGGAVGKPLVGGAAQKATSRYIPGTSSARILDKVSATTGEVVGGGYAFTVPEHGLLPPIDALAHSIGVVGGLKGVHTTQKSMRERVNKINEAFNPKVDDSIREQAQQEIGILVRQEVTENNSTWRADGVEVFVEGINSKGNVRYRAADSDRIQWMKGERFFNEYKTENIDGAPVEILNKRIVELSKELGAFSPEAQAKLYYDGAVPKVPKGESGLNQIPLHQRYQLAKRLQTKKIGETVERNLSIAKGIPKDRVPILGSLFDFLTIGALKNTPWARAIFTRMRSNEARIKNQENVSPLAVDMWRKFNSLPSRTQSWLGTLAKRSGLIHHLNNKNINKEARHEMTGELERGINENSIVKSVADSYKYIGGLLRSKGIIPKEVPLNIHHSPRYMRDSVKESLYELQRELSVKNIRVEGKDMLLDFVRDTNRNSQSEPLSKAQEQVIATVLKGWLKSNKSVGATKYVQESINKHTSTKGGVKKIDWTRAFEEINTELNNLSSNPFYNFTKGRTTNIEWNVEKNGYDVDIFHTDALANKNRYLKDAAEALAVQESFGNNYEVFKNTLETLRIEGRDADHQTLMDLFEAQNVYKKFWTQPLGQGWDAVRSIGKATDYTIEMINNVASGLLVSFGWGPIYNWFQPLISYVPTSGFLPAVKSGLKNLTAEGRAEKKKILEEVGQKSLSEQAIFEQAYGTYSNKNSWHRQFANWASKRSILTLGINPEILPDGIAKTLLRRGTMKGSTEAVHEQAILVGFEAINDLMVVAKTGRNLFERTLYSEKVKKEMERDTFGEKEVQGSERIEQNKAFAREKLLQDFNITYTGGKLTRKQAGDGSVFFADRTQLKRNPANEAYYMSHPAFRNLFRLKSFVIKQTKLAHDTVTKSLAYGNTAPLIRLAMAGAAGTQLIKFQNMLEEVLSGKEQLSRHDEDSLIDGLARVGAFGYMGDTLHAEDKWASVKFQVTPLAYAVGEDLVDDFVSFLSEGRLLDFDEQMDRLPGEVSKYFGGPTRASLRRFEDWKSERNRLVYIKGKKEAEFFNSWRRAHNMVNENDKEKLLADILREAREWNHAYGHIAPIADNHEEIYDMVIKKSFREIRRKREKEKGLRK